MNKVKKGRFVSFVMAFVMIAAMAGNIAFAQEHSHTEQCYAVGDELICGFEEDKDRQDFSEDDLKEELIV